jgi:hypothetical protein
MPSIYVILGLTAGIIGIAGYIPYIISIIRGNTRPNRATWFIWTLIGGVLACSYFVTGNSGAIWLPIGYFVGPLIVAILSLFYGYSEWTKLDTFCIVAALLSLIPWIVSDNATMTLFINLFIDSFGAVPTIVKTFRDPDSEDFFSWFIFFVANTMEVFAVSHWDISGIYPIYLFLLAGSIFTLTLLGKVKKRLSLPTVSK